MIRFAYSSIYGAIVGLIAIALLEILIKHDEDLHKKVKNLQKTSKALIIVQQIAQECWIATLTPIDLEHSQLWIQQQIFIVILLVQQYVDNKIKQIYDILSIVLIIFQGLTFLDRYASEMFKGNNLISSDKLIPMLIILQLLAIMTVFKGLGAGDFLLYVALAMHYMQFSIIPWFQFLISIILGQFIFLVYNVIEAVIFKKSFKENKPFTMFLQIAAIISFA